MSVLYVVTGAGPVGATLAEALLARGDRVRMLTRSGSGPEAAERRAVDARDAAAVAEAMRGADVAFHCIHAAYTAKAWAADLPRAEAALLDAAAANLAPVVFPESLYSYSRPDQVMREDSPRAATGGKRGVRTQLLAARAAHPATTASVAASDFFGPRVLSAHGGERMVRAVLAGRPLRVIGRPDVPHSFTYVPDLVAAMVVVADRLRDAVVPEPDRVWHAPTGPALTQAQLARHFADAAGVPLPKISGIPTPLLRAVGLVSSSMRELAEVAYQFEAPFILDASRSERELGLAPTPIEEAASETVAWWRTQAS